MTGRDGGSQQRPLLHVLATANERLTPEALFEQSNHTPETIDLFYAALKREVDNGQIREIREQDAIYLEVAVGEAE